MSNLAQGIQLARHLGISNFAAGDGSSDQMVLLSGPGFAPFLHPTTFSSAQVGRRLPRVLLADSQ
jgi:hypothetical protein